MGDDVAIGTALQVAIRHQAVARATMFRFMAPIEMAVALRCAASFSSRSATGNCQVLATGCLAFSSRQQGLEGFALQDHTVAIQVQQYWLPNLRSRSNIDRLQTETVATAVEIFPPPSRALHNAEKAGGNYNSHMIHRGCSIRIWWSLHQQQVPTTTHA